ncbi:MAG: toxin-antitoxin system protein [Myxococcales bacterium]|nr:toxin-antitoxin system protein [Myxococcales bacterium]
MGQATVRIEQSTLSTLREIARQEDEAMPAILAKAVEAYRRSRFIERINAGYAELRKDEKALRAYERELGSLEQTVADGLEAETFERGPRVRRGARR